MSKVTDKVGIKLDPPEPSKGWRRKGQTKDHSTKEQQAKDCDDETKGQQNGNNLADNLIMKKKNSKKTSSKVSQIEMKSLNKLNETSLNKHRLPVGNTNVSSMSSLRPSNFFASDITDVRQMENTLLQLLNDFNSGKLQAFGQDITFEQMESVRQQQEKLAKLHFDLNNQNESFGHSTEEGRRIAKDNMSKLIEKLQHLSNSIEHLRSTTNLSQGSSF